MRGRIQVTDAIAAGATVVAAMAAAPAYYGLINGMSVPEGSLMGILLQMVVPVIFIGVIISLGVSGVRDLVGGSR